LKISADANFEISSPPLTTADYKLMRQTVAETKRNIGAPDWLC